MIYHPQDYVLQVAQHLSLRKQLGQNIGDTTYNQTRYLNLEVMAGESQKNFLVNPSNTLLFPFYFDLLHGEPVESADLETKSKRIPSLGQRRSDLQQSMD